MVSQRKRGLTLPRGRIWNHGGVGYMPAPEHPPRVHTRAPTSSHTRHFSVPNTVGRSCTHEIHTHMSVGSGHGPREPHNPGLRDTLNHRKHTPCAEPGADGADRRARTPAEKSAHVEISKRSPLRSVSQRRSLRVMRTPFSRPGAPTSANSPCPLFPTAMCSRGLGDGSRSEACVALKPVSCWHN